jgi:condensation domain-containing protein
VAALVAAMRRLVAFHPILGARVQMRAAVPVFVYSNDVSVYFADESQGEGDEPGRRTRALIDELVWGKFDLERDTLFRPFVVKVAAYTHVIGFVIHHLIGDLVSVRLVAQDIFRGYAGLPSESVESSLQYSDYLIGMGDWLLSTALRYRLDYWVRRLQGVSSCCLPPDFNVPPHECGSVRHEAVELAAALAGELRELAGHMGVTLFTLCLAIYYCVLRRALAASDLVILVMHHGRDHPELAKLVGSFQNQIPVRIAAPAELGFAELARSIQEHCASASERRVPYGNIRHELERNQTPHVFPEFNFVPLAAAGAVRHDQEDQFPLQAQPTTKPVEHATAERYPYHVLDIAVMVSQVKLKCTYLDVLYRRDTIVKHLNLFGELASWLTRHPRGTVGGICEC